VIELIGEKIGNAATIRITGRIDVETSRQFEETCNQWLAGGEKILILDFTQVRYISSLGLRCILSVGKKLDAGGGRLITCGLNAMVKEVFQVSGFDSIFSTFPTMTAALAGL
jgi:anti-anti-sigma factor